MPHMHRIIENELQLFRNRFYPDRPDAGLAILETGTIRVDSEAHRQGDGWSTEAFARDCMGRAEGTVTSIDLDTSVADRVLTRLSPNLRSLVTLRQGYSIEWMASMLEAGQRFDVILLDSDNDPTLILHEYMLAEKLLRRPGLILIDDVVPGSTAIRKGELLVPWLERERPHREFVINQRTGNGFTSGVLSVVYDR